MKSTLMMSALIWGCGLIGAENLIKAPPMEAEGAQVENAQDGKSCWIKVKKGELVASFGLEGDLTMEKAGVSLEASPDFFENTMSLKTDLSKADVNAKNKAVIRFYGVPDELTPAGREIAVEIWAKSSTEGAAATLYIEGATTDGKHFWKAQNIVLTGKWKKYTFEPKLDANLKKIWMRIDCNSQALYYFDNPSISVKNESAQTSSATGEQGSAENLIINGGAERGWYRIAIPGKQNFVMPDDKFISWQGAIRENPYPEWTIDDKVAFSGKHSFKVVFPEGDCVGRFTFNPVPFTLGKPASFSVWIKADRKMRAGFLLFIASGLAYGKDVTVDTEWKRYSIEIPEWGKDAPGVTKIGDVANGYGCGLGVVYPQLTSREPGTVWFDNAAYSMSIAKIEDADKSLVWLRGKQKSQTDSYQPGEKFTADYAIENPQNTAQDLESYFEVFDYFGKSVYKSSPEKFSLPASGTLEKTVSFKPEFLGPATLLFKVRNSAGLETSHSSYFGVYKKAAELDPWFGLDIAAQQNHEIMKDFIKDFGVGSVRLWSSYKKAVDRFTGFDAIPVYKKSGISILMNLSDLKPEDQGEDFLVPKDPSAWAAFVEKSIPPYKGMVDCYEIMNEPNIWPAPKKNPDPEKYTYMSIDTYVKIAEAGSKAVRKADPAAKIGGPTTCHTDVVWTANALAAGIGKYMDVITEHPYRNSPEAPDYEKDIQGLKAVIKQNGKNFDIIASECGNTMVSSMDADIISAKIRNSVAKSIRTQLIARANGVIKYIHFAAGLTSDGNGWNVFFMGNPDNNGVSVANPYMYAMRNMMEQLNGAVPVGKAELGTSLRCYIFEKNGKRIAAIWKCQDEKYPSVVSMRNDDPSMKVFDINGNIVPLERKDGRTSFPISDSPSYIETSLKLAEIQDYLKGSDISGIGNPFTVQLAVMDQSRFAIEVENRINKSISGKVELLSKGIAKGSGNSEFKDLPAGKKAKLVFEAESPVDTSPKSLKVRTSLSGIDAFEVNDFQLKTMLCKKTQAKIKVDGDISDWPADAYKVKLTNANAYKEDPALWNAEDEKISAEVRSAWKDNGLYIAIIVDKPVFFQDAKGSMELWKADSIQVAFDPLKNGKVAPAKANFYDDDDFEYTIGLLQGEPIVYRHYASSVVYDGFQKNLGLVSGEVDAVVKAKDGKTVYELRFAPRSVSPFRLEADSSMLWNFIINMNNGKGRMGWLELSPGIGQNKSPGEFMNIVLVD